MDRDYYSRSRIYNQPQIKKQHRLLATALKKLFHNKISQTLGRLKNNCNSYNRKMSRMHKILSVHNEVCLVIGFQKIKINFKKKQLDSLVIKNAFMLSQKVKAKFLNQAWGKLNTNVMISRSGFIKKIQLVRASLISRSLNKLYLKSKSIGWQKLNQHKIVVKIKKRISSISTIFKSCQRRILTYSWIKLLKTNNKIKQKQIQAQIQDFQLQLQDMKVQIDNKNDNISRLQEQIIQLKQYSTFRANDTSSFVLNTSSRNRSATQIMRNKSKFTNYQIQSNDGSVGRDPSFGSLLGNSMFSWKSRASNKSNKAEQCQCQVCSYKLKYQKYKATNSTLQKQLQIIKTQLDFTKDMNEHMQNEIKGYFNNEDLQNKVEKMKIQLKECQKQKQAFREKVVKYQKYVAKLKMEFKVKIEEIYRRVKKSG